MARLLILLLALLTPAALVQARAAPPDRVVILISLDGFRADYLDKGVTPNLAELAKGGVNAAMRPSFPSKTFPNHWTLVTGMVPDHHGIVANRMEDPARPGELFTMASDDPFWWNTAEPIWAMAERAGIRTATMFWPGSDVGWGGTRSRPAAMTSGGERPSDWQEYNQAITNRQRIDAVLDWMRRPAAIRPRLVTLYFDTIDTAGHEFGPDDPRIEPALTEADARIGELVQGLRDMAIPADLVIVADHGMAATSSERVIALDRLADPALYRVIEQGSYAALVPTEGNEERLWKALSASGPNHTCWRKDQIPARLHYGASPRV
ncbi:MAG TPA: ectonucleotide pyrophosphatase/phosphodiesterase, partial [Novosphingobium sp.]|nr:ectonucleotide pyrophosphatase/phosphodiesterase [Novosphingobium sp.]